MLPVTRNKTVMWYMVGKGCRHVAFVSDVAQKATLLNVDRLIWKASQVRDHISKRNWTSISRLERGTMVRWCFSWAWNLIYIENKLEKKKRLCILRAKRPWVSLDYFLSMTAGKKKCCFAKLALVSDEQRGSPFCYFPGSWSIRWLSCLMCKFSVPRAVLHKAAATQPFAIRSGFRALCVPL